VARHRFLTSTAFEGLERAFRLVDLAPVGWLVALLSPSGIEFRRTKIRTKATDTIKNNAVIIIVGSQCVCAASR
jgi:hypothetical protein